MRESRIFNSKGLLAAVLITGMGVVTAPVSAQSSAQPVDYSAGYINSSDATLYVAENFKGKPPYKRHTANQQRLEQVRFARFEEKPGVAKDGHRSMYHGVQGKRPPFNRRR